MVFAVIFLLALSGCRQQREQSAQFFVFGTIIEIKLWGAGPEQSGRAFSMLQKEFQAMHRNWHAWEPGTLTEINTAFRRGNTITATPQIVEMIRRSQTIEEKTGGRFNPAIGGLIELWGFHTSDYPIEGPPPTSEAIERLLAMRPSSRDIEIDGLQLSSSNPAVQLDFGGIAKGYAVDIAIAKLRGLGIDNAIVNAGGDLRAIGDHGTRPWRVAVRKPDGGNIGSVEVQGDEAIFTSGNYERFRQDQTVRYPHILDPSTGWPAKDIASVTIIADEGLLADAAATALLVAGLDGWREVAAGLKLDQLAIVDESGTVHLTPKMESRIQFMEASERVTVDPVTAN